MTKKCLAAALAMILVFLLAACGGGDDGVQSTAPQPEQSTPAPSEAPEEAAGEQTKLTWMSWGHARPQEIRNEALQAAFPDLAAQYVIEPIVGGNDTGSVIEKMRLALASNSELPDIFQTSSMFFPEMAASGMLADLTDLYDKYDSELLDGMRDLVTYEGRQYAFPYCENTLVWIYRADMFEEAGIDVADIQSIDDFIAAGDTLRATFPDSYMHAGNLTDFAEYYGWCGPGNGSQMTDDAGNYVFKDDPATKKVLEDMKKLYDSGVVYDVASWTPDWEQGFADGTIASYLTCNWFKDAAFLPNYAPDTAGKWGASIWPEVGGGRGGSENGGAMIMVLDNSPNKDAAIEVLENLCFTKEGNLALYAASGNALTPLISEAYNDPSVAAGDDFFGDVIWKAELESMSTYTTWDFTPAASLEAQILKPYIERYISGELSMDEALDKATQDMLAQIGNPLEMG